MLNALPPNLRQRMVDVLRIKIPANPAMVAASVMVRSAGTLEHAIKDAFLGPLTSSSEGQALGEALAAHYCLAVVVLAEDEFAGTQGQGSPYHFFTASTYYELKKLAASDAISLVDDKNMEAAESLYLMDKPNLRQLAAQLPEYCFLAEVEKVAATANWFLSFGMKVAIRIAASLNLSKANPNLIPLQISVQSDLLSSVKVLRRMRPVFVENKSG